MEKWVKDFENIYSVTDDGKVYSYKRGKKIEMKQYLGYKGYYRINFANGKRPKYFNVHRLIAQTFIENKENKPTVNHINGIKTDNRIENLEWSNCSEQQLHAIKLGLRGVSNNEHMEKMKNKSIQAKSKFTADEVSEILEMMSVLKLSCNEMARLANVSACTIKNIVNEKTQYFKTEVAL